MRPLVHPAAILCWPTANGEGCSARSRSPLAPLHATARLGGRGPVDDRGGRGNRADRCGWTPLSRRRLLPLVQRSRAPAPGDRRRDPRAARPRRPLDDAGALPPRGRRPRRPARRDRPRRAQPRLLLGLRVHGRRGRAQDGLPVLAAPRRPARPEDLVHLPRSGLPRGHDRLGLRRGHAALPRHLRAAPLRGPSGEARRHRRHGAPARPARGGGRGRRHRAAGAGRGGDAHPPARVPARGPAALRPPRRPADLRRGRHRVRAHGDDVRLRAGGRLTRPALPRQGADRRLHAARRHPRDRADLRGLPRGVTPTTRPSSTATPTRATRSPVPRRSPRWTSSSASGRSSASSPRSGCSPNGSGTSSGCPRCTRSASAA